MKIYLVGGAVRDTLLHFPIKERDWVVVGSTPEEMIKRGFKPVGKDFPVFLEPTTKEEYALARTERKVGRGYTGFEFNASSDVTLEEDLKRRDLTINAMALEDPQDPNTLIDYYGGRSDLEHKLLRHVSDAFVEDPVRILRVGRFASRFFQYGFTVASETIQLMQKMVHEGEVNALVPERVWKELERALTEKTPEAFFYVLQECGALNVLFPELVCVHSSERFIGEKNLKRVSRSMPNSIMRFGALVMNLPKQFILELTNRYKLPGQYKEFALGLHHIHDFIQDELTVVKETAEPFKNESSFQSEIEFKAKKILNLLTETDAFRRKDRFDELLKTADFLELPSISLLKKCYEETKSINPSQFVEKGLTGKQIGESIQKERLERITSLLKNN